MRAGNPTRAHPLVAKEYVRDIYITTASTRRQPMPENVSQTGPRMSDRDSRECLIGIGSLGDR